MYIRINSKNYTAIRDLSFAPETDLMGSTMPITEFTAEIVTGDAIAVGQLAKLYTDDGYLWASYWLIRAERVPGNAVRIKAQSLVAFMDRVMLPAKYYSGGLNSLLLDVDHAITPTMEPSWLIYPTGSLGVVPLSGFCPEQTARERLHWGLTACGAYLKTWLEQYLTIYPIPDGTEANAVIPMDVTYMRPKVTYRDYVSSVTVMSYSFEQRAPEQGEKSVEDADGVRYVYTETPVTLANPYISGNVPANEIVVSGVMLINEDNVDDVLSRLAAYYFHRADLELDAIDNGEYMPAQRVTAFADADTLMTGYIGSASFTFGTQAKARLKILGAESVNGATLTVAYLWNGIQLDKQRHMFPAGYSYSIVNPYIDMNLNGHRYVFMPEHVSTEGTMPAVDTTVTENETPALDLDLSNGVLEIISVDSATASEGVVTIG